ncbi:MAG: hypothetical protein WC718_09310 [Phycisphaerales bacterium]
MANLKLHRDDSDEAPQDSFGEGATPFRDSQRRWEPRLAGRPASEDVIRGAENALDRIDRAMANLRDLMGEGFEGPDGPRAA